MLTEWSKSRRVAGLWTDTRGAVFVEYSVLVGAIALGGSVGLIGIGVSLVRSFDFVRGLLLCSVP
jgi:Flp pilus assembly pilin Flp